MVKGLLLPEGEEGVDEEGGGGGAFAGEEAGDVGAVVARLPGEFVLGEAAALEAFFQPLSEGGEAGVAVAGADGGGAGGGGAGAVRVAVAVGGGGGTADADGGADEGAAGEGKGGKRDGMGAGGRGAWGEGGSRKGRGVEVREATLEGALGLERGSVSVLVTPLGLQGAADRDGMVKRAREVLEGDGGVWWLVDVLPVSMAGHRVHRYFPGVWRRLGKVYWTGQQVCRVLREVGFEVEMEEWTFGEGIRLGVVKQIAERRGGMLGMLGEEEYRAGIERLEREVRERGKGRWW